MKNLKKRITAIFTALAVCFASLGALPEFLRLPGFVIPAGAENVTEIAVSRWTDMVKAFKSGETAAASWSVEDGVKTVTLKSCIKVTSYLAVGSELSFGSYDYVLDLNGYGIRGDMILDLP